MPYPPLSLSPDIPLNVRLMVEKGIDPMLREVHIMLGVQIDDGKHLLQNSIANTLLAVISGVSTTLYARDGDSKAQFTGQLVDNFPWDADSPVGATREEAAQILWEYCRNPLAHRLGMHPKGARIVKFGQVHGRMPADVDALATSSERPTTKTPLVVRPEAYVLWIDALYWSVRQMVQRMIDNRAQVIAAEKWIQKGGFLPPRLRKS
jgi:hypothetical protein